ncbi:hypothetical protein BWD42_18115 [Sphingobacterium sp. CZ-UAM]|nr:hypothetical protein BWD42_18115 [Sphingobacterium sp. CZ-UAM]
MYNVQLFCSKINKTCWKYFCERIALDFRNIKRACLERESEPDENRINDKGFRGKRKKNEDVQSIGHPRFVCLKIRS